MRLIDADKIVYMWKQDINGNFHDGVTLESIVGKTPTENVNDLIAKELEKVKEEINNNPQVYSDEYFVSVKFVNKVLDKHIAELDCINDCEHCEYVECPKGE